MQHRRRVFIETPQGRISAGFSVPTAADAADVSMRLREKGWAPYRLRLDLQQDCWIAAVIDWRHTGQNLAKRSIASDPRFTVF